jgi:hypothetical protein
LPPRTMRVTTAATRLLSALPILLAYAHDNLKQAVLTLQPQLSSGAVVTFPWEPRWPDLQVRSSSPRISPDYGVVVEVATEADVQATVAFANRYNIPFLAVSGTHGWPSSLEKLSDGIQINLRKLNTTVLSPGGKTAHVGGGTLQYEITRSLFALGKYAGKTCPFGLNVHCANNIPQSLDSLNVSQLQVRCSEVAIVCCRANMATLLTTSFPRVS